MQHFQQTFLTWWQTSSADSVDSITCQERILDTGRGISSDSGNISQYTKYGARGHRII